MRRKKEKLPLQMQILEYGKPVMVVDDVRSINRAIGAVVGEMSRNNRNLSAIIDSRSPNEVDPSGVIEHLRETILDHMGEHSESLDWCRVADAEYIDQVNEVIPHQRVAEGEIAAGLRLLMRDGSGVLLRVSAVRSLAGGPTA